MKEIRLYREKANEIVNKETETKDRRKASDERIRPLNTLNEQKENFDDEVIGVISELVYMHNSDRRNIEETERVVQTDKADLVRTINNKETETKKAKQHLSSLEKQEFGQQIAREAIKTAFDDLGELHQIRELLNNNPDRIDWKSSSLTVSEQKQISDMSRNGELELIESKEFVKDPARSALHLPKEAGIISYSGDTMLFTPNSETAKSILNDYGRSSVEYFEGEPDFSPFTEISTQWGSVRCEVEIPHMTASRKNPNYDHIYRPRGAGHDPSYELGNFAQADNELLKLFPEGTTIADIQKFRKDHKLTWHECRDGKTMQLVPTVLHSACPHSGGVSEMEYRQAFGDVAVEY